MQQVLRMQIKAVEAGLREIYFHHCVCIVNCIMYYNLFVLVNSSLTTLSCVKKAYLKKQYVDQQTQILIKWPNKLLNEGMHKSDACILHMMITVYKFDVYIL